MDKMKSLFFIIIIVFTVINNYPVYSASVQVKNFAKALYPKDCGLLTDYDDETSDETSKSGEDGSGEDSSEEESEEADSTERRRKRSPLTEDEPKVRTKRDSDEDESSEEEDSESGESSEDSEDSDEDDDEEDEGQLEPGDQPWVVYFQDAGTQGATSSPLGIGSSPRCFYNCAGALINNRYILTAASCLQDENKMAYNITAVTLGATNLDDPGQSGMVSKVKQSTPHPEYDPRTGANDVGLIRLSEDIDFTKYIRPVCMPLKALVGTLDIDAGAHVKAIGWRNTSAREQEPPYSTKEKSDILMSVDMEVCDYNCDKAFDEFPKDFTMNPVKDICAYRSKTKTCFGDSGGPLLARQDKGKKRFILVGITTSRSWRCTASGPTLFAKVAGFLPWINQNMKTNDD